MFDSQHPNASSQPSLTPVPDPMPFAGLGGQCMPVGHRQTDMQARHPYRVLTVESKP